MPQTQYEAISFAGYSGEIKASLITPASAVSKLAVVFPGAGYSCKEPLLYFGIQVLLKNGFQVIAIDKIYADDPSWKNLTNEKEARSVVENDAEIILKSISERFGKPPELLYGRSLGTYSIACVLEKELAKPNQIIWQTPALGSKWELMKNCEIPGFGILGTADHYYEKAFPNLPRDRIIIEGANHAMEIPDDPVRSTEILKQVTEATDKWILKTCFQ